MRVQLPVLPKTGCVSLIYIVVPLCAVICAPSLKPKDSGVLKLLGGRPNHADEPILETFHREGEEEGGKELSTRNLPLIPFWVRELTETNAPNERRGIPYKHHVYGLMLQEKQVSLRKSGVPEECGPPIFVTLNAILGSMTNMPITHCSAVARAMKLLEDTDFLSKLPPTFTEVSKRHHQNILRLASWNGGYLRKTG